MTKQLSYKQKVKRIEDLVERDGYDCFFCKKEFSSKERPIIEHLNRERTDNRIENNVLSCQSCNIKKAKGNNKLLIKADEKLFQNEDKTFVRERDLDRIFSKNSNKQEPSKEIDINTKNVDVVQNYIKDRVESWDLVELKDTLDSCVFLCREKTGHGSQQCVRNYIDSLTSSVGPYEIIKNERKKRIIVKRATNTITPSSFFY